MKSGMTPTEWQAQCEEVVSRAGLRNYDAWLRSRVEQLAVGILSGASEWSDIDRLMDWKGHQLIMEWKFDRWDVPQFFPLQTQSRHHLTLVLVTDASPVEMVVDDTPGALWVADIRDLTRGTCDRSQFTRGTFTQLAQLISKWKDAAEECHRRHRCWDNGCPFPTPEGFLWRPAFAD